MSTETSRRRWTGWLIVATAVAAVVALVAVFALTGSEDPEPEGAAGQPTDDRDPPAPRAQHEWLWPFANEAEMLEWQRGYRVGGHSPWHLDAEATALAFTTGYLGFTEVDQVVHSTIEATTAEITVGYRGEGDSPSPAAVLRLVRLGGGADAPWEVVGSAEGGIMTLTEPAAGAEVSSPMRVGGTISGVDESIRVQVRDPAAPTPIGESCCVPAGGENTPWSTSVSFRGPPGATLTVVAATGGHITDVERFVVAGVRPAA